MRERRVEQETLPAAPKPDDAMPALPPHYASPVKVASGGMGDLFRVRDRRLDRDVIMKRLRTSGDARSLRSSFEREAALQAALGHPGIVSVFELGEDSAGIPYFTMQEVQGTTLSEAIDRPPTYPAPAPWSRRALLEVLARVALTVAFAHDKGVLHLDLKPENIMLGAFGEVYVLDWGIARSTRPGESAAPELVGTPQYMAPEQAEAVVAPDERADVFALGAILFEILTTEMLRRAPSTWAALQAAREDAQAAERLAAARVPVELALLCTRATALDRNDRLPSARAFNEALERWLDGERDVGARQQAAQRALDRARDARRDQEPRASIMRHLARAVAIDPGCEPAIAELADLMLESAKTVPPSAAHELEADAAKAGKRAALAGLVTYAAWFSLLPIALVIGVRSFSALALIVAPAFVTALQSGFAYRRGWSAGLTASVIVTSYVCIGGFATAFGPLVVLPGLISANSIALLPLARDRAPLRRLVIACGVLAFGIPLALETLHLVPPSYAWDAGRMIILPRLLELPPGAAVILAVGGLLNILSTHFSVAAAVKQQLTIQTAAVSQAHVLRELVPDALHAVAPRRAADDFGSRDRSGVPSIRPQDGPSQKRDPSRA
ncbi:MAG: serine/threonine-protein kinase [Polyangiaceae bacterium]